jgi:hypothetical protein
MLWKAQYRCRLRPGWDRAGAQHADSMPVTPPTTLQGSTTPLLCCARCNLKLLLNNHQWQLPCTHAARACPPPDPPLCTPGQRLQQQRGGGSAPLAAPSSSPAPAETAAPAAARAAASTAAGTQQLRHCSSCCGAGGCCLEPLQGWWPAA